MMLSLPRMGTLIADEDPLTSFGVAIVKATLDAISVCGFVWCGVFLLALADEQFGCEAHGGFGETERERLQVRHVPEAQFLHVKSIHGKSHPLMFAMRCAVLSTSQCGHSHGCTEKSHSQISTWSSARIDDPASSPGPVSASVETTAEVLPANLHAVDLYLFVRHCITEGE